MVNFEQLQPNQMGGAIPGVIIRGKDIERGYLYEQDDWVCFETQDKTYRARSVHRLRRMLTGQLRLGRIIGKKCLHNYADISLVLYRRTRNGDHWTDTGVRLLDGVHTVCPGGHQVVYYTRLGSTQVNELQVSKYGDDGTWFVMDPTY